MLEEQPKRTRAPYSPEVRQIMADRRQAPRLDATRSDPDTDQERAYAERMTAKFKGLMQDPDFGFELGDLMGMADRLVGGRITEGQYLEIHATYKRRVLEPGR